MTTHARERNQMDDQTEDYPLFAVLSTRSSFHIVDEPLYMMMIDRAPAFIKQKQQTTIQKYNGQAHASYAPLYQE